MKNIIEGTPYVARRFLSAPPNNLLLKIFVSKNQFQFLIADQSNTVLYVHPFEMNPETSSFFSETDSREVIDSIELLAKPFSNVSVGIFTPDFTIVPEEMMSKEAEQFFRNHFLKQDSPYASEFLIDRIPQVNASLLYSAPQQVMHSLQEKFTSFSHQHSSTSQIKNFSPRNQALNVYAVIQSNWLQVFCLSGHQLKFANAFHYHTAEDFIYYLTAVYRDLDLNPENIPLILYGEIVRDSAIYQIANKYVRIVKLGKTSDAWKFEDDYPFPLHFYSTLFSL